MKVLVSPRSIVQRLRNFRELVSSSNMPMTSKSLYLGGTSRPLLRRSGSRGLDSLLKRRFLSLTPSSGCLLFSRPLLFSRSWLPPLETFWGPDSLLNTPIALRNPIFSSRHPSYWGPISKCSWISGLVCSNDGLLCATKSHSWLLQN